jgi:hypothetical protein
VALQFAEVMGEIALERLNEWRPSKKLMVRVELRRALRLLAVGRRAVAGT